MRQGITTKKGNTIQIADIKRGRIFERVILGLVLLHVHVVVAITAVSGPTLLRIRHMSVAVSQCAKDILSVFLHGC